MEELSVQLHTQSDYSLLRSAFNVEALVNRAKGLGFADLALTDYQTTGGHVELARFCAREGLRPLFGLETTVHYPPEFSIDARGDRAELVLLAENDEGYGNLLALASKTSPLLLGALGAAGLFVLEGGLNGQLTKLVEEGLTAKARALDQWYQSSLGSAYYLRLDFAQGPALQDFFPAGPFVISQDGRYGQEGDQAVLKVLAKISGVESPLPAYPLLDWETLTRNVKPEIIENTVDLARRCQARLPVPSGRSVFSREPAGKKSNLAELVLKGAQMRYPVLTEKIKKRIALETKIIQEMGFSDYFLIVAELVDFARGAKIPVGPGRGSAAGSIVAYCLGITSIDPLAWGLLFERFLNPSRQSRPDIDLDFCYERRGEVLKYAGQRFGAERVAQVGTYGTLGERSARQEVTRLFGESKTGAELNRLAGQIRGLKRHRSTHAAGVIITAEPTLELTAVYGDREMPVTHLDMYSLEELGLAKIDLLGLRTLTLLARQAEEVQKRDPDFNLENIPLEDKKTFELLSAGKSLGLFQLESSLFQDLLRALQPNSFQDLVALLALGRPGPLNMFPEFLKARQNPAQVRYLHPKLEEILGETYGFLLYQEQVMEIAAKIGRLSLGEADLLRRALGKSDQAMIKKWRQQFLQGAADSGLSQQEGQRLFQVLVDFSGYAFNKAHSVSYARITWSCAYLKAHYPLEFFLVLLNEGGLNREKNEYLLDCQSLGVKLLPPDVQLSPEEFSAEKGCLRLGLSTIKGLGLQTARKIVEQRKRGPFRDFAAFRARTGLPREALETLALAGALDSLGERNGHLRALGASPQVRLVQLRQERDLLGVFASLHPAAPFQPLLRHIQGEAQVVSGAVIDVTRKGRDIQGLLDTPAGAVAFQGQVSEVTGLIQKEVLLALFGREQGGVFFVENVFPLGPVLVISPQADQLEQLQAILAGRKGPKPVILRLGEGVFHSLPPEFWVGDSGQIEMALKTEGFSYQWFDPWKENIIQEGFPAG